jgi:2-polyprenyl-3-methyl-5-hydroxy-6-metoxy-1,4-benzoquinol methylase
MTKLDLFIQSQRIDMARRFLRPGSRVLDLGCGDGALFKQVPEVWGIGIDPTLSAPIELPNAKLLPGRFPEDTAAESEFDFVTMLASLEHLPRGVRSHLGTDCYRALKPKGKVIITVPSAKTDILLSVLKTLHLIDGQSLEEHHGYNVSETPQIFSSLKMVLQKRFQLGFNNFFVFEKAAVAGAEVISQQLLDLKAS